MSTTAQMLSTISESLQDRAKAQTVYAEPICVGNKVVVPVAKIAFGFGAGGSNKEKASAEDSRKDEGGGGGGMRAYPVGALEITEGATRFISLSNKGLWGILLTAAFLLGSATGARRALRYTRALLNLDFYKIY